MEAGRRFSRKAVLSAGVTTRSDKVTLEASPNISRLGFTHLRDKTICPSQGFLEDSTRQGVQGPRTLQA